MACVYIIIYIHVYIYIIYVYIYIYLFTYYIYSLSLIHVLMHVQVDLLDDLFRNLGAVRQGPGGSKFDGPCARFYVPSTQWEPFLPGSWGWNMDGSWWYLNLWAGWWFGCQFLFSHILGIVIPIDFHIFQRGSNHQPVTYGGWGWFMSGALATFSHCPSLSWSLCKALLRRDHMMSEDNSDDAPSSELYWVNLCYILTS